MTRHLTVTFSCPKRETGNRKRVSSSILIRINYCLPASQTSFLPIDGIYRKHHLFRDQFVARSPDIDDADAGVFGEGAAEAGDEDLEAAGVEEVVVAPEVEEEVLHRHDFSVGAAQASEDFGFAVGEAGGFSFREIFKRLGCGRALLRMAGHQLMELMEVRE